MVSRYHSGINGERQTFNVDDDRHDYADEFTHIFQVLLNRMIGFLEILWPGVMGAAKRWQKKIVLILIDQIVAKNNHIDLP